MAYDLEFVDTFNGDGQAWKYKQINPNGTVPTQEDNSVIIFEAGAICMYLTELPMSSIRPSLKVNLSLAINIPLRKS